MRARRLDFGKLAKVLATLAIIFIAAFALIFAVVQDYQLLFYMADLAFVLLGINFILYLFYNIFFGKGRWIRIMVLGLSGLLFIILGISFASANLASYLGNSNASPIIGTNILVSLTAIAVGGILYYMTFNGHPLVWIEEIQEKVEDEEHKNKWFAKIIRKLRKV